MIDITIRIKNPTKYPIMNRWAYQTIQIFKNKRIEFQVAAFPAYLLEFKLDLNICPSHNTGPHFKLGLFGFSVFTALYNVSQ